MNKKKSCMTCAYMVEMGAQIATEQTQSLMPEYIMQQRAIPLSKDVRNFQKGDGDWIRNELYQQIYTGRCFRQQWHGKITCSETDIATLLAESEKHPNEIIILDARGEPFIVSTYSCDDYYPYEKLGPRTVEKCGQEQQERKERKRFRITTGIGIATAVIGLITALAVVATAIMTWLQ